MTRKKGKLMTFLWSLIPGAGEMYLGFFKTGVSLMATFVILLSLSGFLQLNVLSLLAPVVWFYSFFHANNINALPDDEFYALEDDYLVHMEDIRKNSLFFKTHRKFTAACLICFGISVLWSNLYRLLFSHLLPIIALPEQAEEILEELHDLNFLKIMRFSSADGELKVYQPSASYALIPFLYFGSELMVSQGASWLRYDTRERAFFPAPLGTNGVATQWGTKSQGNGGNTKPGLYGKL